jgi:hypothetical protein
MASRALIVGVTGLIGSNLAEHLVSKGWKVYGIAGKLQGSVPGVRPIAADLLGQEALRASLNGVDPTQAAHLPGDRHQTGETNLTGTAREALRDDLPRLFDQLADDLADCGSPPRGVAPGHVAGCSAAAGGGDS